MLSSRLRGSCSSSVLFFRIILAIANTIEAKYPLHASDERFFAEGPYPSIASLSITHRVVVCKNNIRFILRKNHCTGLCNNLEYTITFRATVISGDNQETIIKVLHTVNIKYLLSKNTYHFHSLTRSVKDI